MIRFLLALAAVASTPRSGPDLRTFQLPEDEARRSVFDATPPRDWATAYKPATLARTFVDPEQEGEFVHAYLEHVRSIDMDGVFAPIRDFGVEGFENVETNGPLLRERLIQELSRMEAMRTRKDFEATIYPTPSAGDFGVMLGSLNVPFRTTTTDENLAMTKTFTVTADQGAVLRHIAETLERYAQSRHDDSRLQTARRMSEINDAWKNYLQNGYSQYPWELLINSELYRGPWYEPPDHQLVVFHPEVGFSADILHGASEANVDAALMIHALGYVKYTGTSNDSYFGGSLSFMYDDEDKLAAGLAAHLGFAKFGTALPAFTVGVYWRDFDHGLSRGNLELGMSIDLLRLLDREGGDKAFLQQALQASR
jgi:hypothetical protein